jgi:inner membrane protein
VDSLTHIALGAIIGETVASRSLGKRSLAIGALAQSIPDIDFLAGFWMDADNNLLAHRGFTHSILFMVAASLFCALAMERWYRARGMALNRWMLLFLVEMGTHLLLDVMNVYGVGLFEPFSQVRVSLNVLFVADPLFSIAPGVALLVLLFIRNTSRVRRQWTVAGWTVPAAYLVIAIIVKLYINDIVRTEMARQNMPIDRYFVTPTMMNILLWYAVVEDKGGYHIAYRSVFDKGPLTWTFHSRRETLLEPIREREDVQHLLRFSKGYYVMSQVENRPMLSDLRFGQVFGWNNPQAPFVFNYDLGYPDDNALVIQRGRFTEWTFDNLRLTLHRIAGRF